jgi:hypothetical protein
MRAVQMMYDTTGGGKKFRMYNSINLAPWHSFKHTCLELWRTYADSVFAPLWHHLYPGHMFFKKPGSLNSVISHLLYLQLGYPQYCSALSAVAAQDDLGARARFMVDDFKFLVEIAIPVVCTLSLRSIT